MVKVNFKCEKESPKLAMDNAYLIRSSEHFGSKTLLAICTSYADQLMVFVPTDKEKTYCSMYDIDDFRDLQVLGKVDIEINVK